MIVGPFIGRMSVVPDMCKHYTNTYKRHDYDASFVGAYNERSHRHHYTFFSLLSHPTEHRFGDSEMADIPVVDFAKATNGTREEKERVAKSIDDAFRNVGFVYLKNHGVPLEMVDECFGWVSNHLSQIEISPNSRVV
jgi:hypothetical protein